MRKLLDLGIAKQAEAYGVLNINIPNLPLKRLKAFV